MRMKKTLLISMALLAAMTVSAQKVERYSDIAKSTPAPIPFTDEMEVATETHDVEFTGDRSKLKKAPKVKADELKAWYNRPAGDFYGMYITKDENDPVTTYSTVYAPYLWGTPYRDNTFVNASTGAFTEWSYQLYDRSSRSYTWYSSSDKDLTVHPILESDTVPVITATDDGSTIDTYTLKGGKVTSGALAAEYNCRILNRVDYQTAFSNTSTSHLWYSSKFFAANTNRDFTKLAGSYYTTGAKDADGGTTGRWYGRNYSGIDGVCMAFEKPQNPYCLRHVGVRAQSVKVAAGKDVTIKAIVYRLPEIPAMPVDTTAPVHVYPTEADIIAQGTYTFDAETYSGSSVNGIFSIPLVEEEDGLTFEVTPSVDYPILVEITGYNVEDMDAAFTMLYSSDQYDEGHGELCYLKRSNSNYEGGYEYVGQCNYFVNSTTKEPLKYYRGVSVLIDIEKPYMVWNYLNETGEYNFPTAGADTTVQVYTYRGADEWTITDEDDQDLPEWITVEPTDEMEEGEYTNVTDAKITCAPLPEGTAYRECNVKLAIPGAYLIYKASQGEKPASLTGDVNGDGVVNTSDVTALLNIILGSAETVPAADVNGDGVVNTSDVTALINIILGA